MSLPISGFTAVPNPMMLSFLATQGFAIMYYGGAGWQFGKRKVSGMSNEEVNSMTPNQFLQRLQSETKTMIPTMQQGMQDMTPLVKTTMVLFGTYIKEAIAAFPKVVEAAIGGGGGDFSNIPTSDQLASTGLPPGQMASFLHFFKKIADATKGKTDIQKEAANIEANRIEILRQRAREADARTKEQQRLQITAKLPPVRKLVKINFNRRKRKATTSAIMSRKQFISDISRLGKETQVLWGKAVGERFSSRRKNNYLREMTRKKQQMQFIQQKLVNLMQLYEF